MARRDWKQSPGFRIGPGRYYRDSDDEFKVSREEIRDILERALEIIEDDDGSLETFIDVLIEELEKLR